MTQESAIFLLTAVRSWRERVAAEEAARQIERERAMTVAERRAQIKTSE